MSDAKALALSILFLALFVAAVAFSVWVRFFAPCGDIGWLPIHEMPGRCLTLVRQ